MRLPVLTMATLVMFSATLGAQTNERPDYLKAVRAYADCLITHGQDVYGAATSPLFAEALDRRTLKLLEGEALNKAAAIKREEWGIRPHDRMLPGANPMHCMNLYEILYALTQVTGERKYAEQADASLKFFLQNCQSPATGLFYWGEHAGWDFRLDAPMQGGSANTHEFYFPWTLWDKCFALAPAACLKFARGLWDHQIGNQQTGDFSRHAAISKHGPGTTAPYPRHGGFYIETWAEAYKRTKDPVYLKAIETVATRLEAMRRSGGMIVGGSTAKPTLRPRAPGFAVSLGEVAPMLPDELGARLREIATANDDPPSEKKDTPPAEEEKKKNFWTSGYGGAGGEIATVANIRMLRYRQVKLPQYKTEILAAAEQYMKEEIDLTYPVYPGTVGKVILLMLNARELTGEKRYLDRADHFAREALKLFTGDGCPLPKATHMYDHYEAVTGADMLMMALMQLWAVEQQPPVSLPLTFADR